MSHITLTFDSSEKAISKSIEVVREFLDSLVGKNMYYYFPFTSDTDAQTMQSQIATDKERHGYDQAVEDLVRMWNKYGPEVLKRLADQEHTADYRCVITLYGPQGYFYTPSTVYVNITKGDPNEWVHTLIHELLHLVLVERTNGISESETEKLIDQTFVDLFGDLFPDYQVQEVSG